MTTITGYATVSCSNNSGRGCGRWFAMSDTMHDILTKSDGRFWCPYCGMAWVFGCDTEMHKLRRQVEQKAAEIARMDQRLAAERSAREHEEKVSRSLRGVVTRTKNRVGHGVCPCCTRSFTNLRRHMATKHPDYATRDASHSAAGSS